MIDVRGRRVLFVCDFGSGFTGESYRTCGVGGTDALVVLTAEELARRGTLVTVAQRGADARVRDVSYRTIDGATADPADVVVLVKRWSDAVARVDAPVRVFFGTDVHVDADAQIDRCCSWSTAAFTGSDYQRDAMERVVGTGRLMPLGWPVEVAAYADAADVRGRTLLYCSVPDRGLYYLKDLFPRIRRHVTDARLVITGDFSLWGLNPARNAFLKYFEGQPGVDYLGHVDRPTLIEAQLGSRIMAYPCRFPEGFCLAAAECMAAGTVPVTTNDFALTTTVGAAGVLIPGKPRGWLYRRRFVSAVVRLLRDDAEWLHKSRACRAAARERFSPSAIVDRMLETLESRAAARA